MPIIKLGYGYGLVGLGATGDAPGVVTPPAGSQPGFLDGLKLWTTPGRIWPAIQALPAMVSGAPMAALGFVVPALALGFLLLGGAGGAGYVAGRRRARKGNPRGRARRAANPRRHARRNPKDAPAGYLLEAPGKRPVFYRGRGGALDKAIAAGRRSMAGKPGTFAVTDSVSARTTLYNASGSRKANPRRRASNPRRKSTAVHNYEVVVGNVGTVYRGRQGFQAHIDYNTYVGISKRGGGKVAGEPVTLFVDGEIIKEYQGTSIE